MNLDEKKICLKISHYEQEVFTYTDITEVESICDKIFDFYHVDSLLHRQQIIQSVK